MDSYSIGLSGLGAAQSSLDIIGNNIANAASENYHRQQVNLSPSYMKQIGSTINGGGVDFDKVTRQIDIFLEQEILRQQSSLEQVSRELMTLGTVETAFGEFSGGSSLSTSIDDFFTALDELSAHPQDKIYQNQLLSAADILTARFRSLGNAFSDRKRQVIYEAENTVEEINTLLGQIAELNGEIERIESGEGQNNNLLDKRDGCISKLSELINVQTVSLDDGVVNVYAGGIPAVTGASVTELEVGLTEANTLGISVSGGYNYVTEVGGGRLEGLLKLYNEHLSEIIDGLDNLAESLIGQFNQYHVQGVGSSGSFTELTGWEMISEDVSAFDTPVTDGSFYIRVIDGSTGSVSRHQITVDSSSDTLSSIASDISAIDGLSASVASSHLIIQAEPDYEFDFIPAVLPEPTNSSLTGGTPPSISVSGNYTDSSNQTFTFTVSGSGSVGNGTLGIEVRNGAGELVKTLNVGSGYAAGDELSISNGINVSVSMGDLNDGDSFEVEAFANTDTSGFLSAVGLNTFFSGTSSRNINICSDISSSPGRIAVSLGSEMTDNNNALRLVGLQEESMSSLDSVTLKDYYLQIVSDLGQKISVAKMREENSQVLVQNLKSQRSERSGVDINEEAANMLIFEQMFQGMSRYMIAVRDSMRSLMELV